MRSLSRSIAVAAALVAIAAVAPVDSARAAPRDDTTTAQPLVADVPMVSADFTMGVDSVALLVVAGDSANTSVELPSAIAITLNERPDAPVPVTASVHRKPASCTLVARSRPPCTGHLATSDRLRLLNSN